MNVSSKYLRLLMFVLLGYAVAGRGFAYLGLPPLFIGEITIAAGVFTIGCLTPRAWKFVDWRVWLLILFMAWGAFRTVPYIGAYGFDALRDGMSWGYAIYALIVAALLTDDPQRFVRFVSRYRTFAKILLVACPFVWYATFKLHIPGLPWSQHSLIHVKGGDMIVHLTGVFAYVALIGGIQTWLPLIFLPLTVGLNITGRAAMLTFTMGAMLVMLCRPLSVVAWRLWATVVLGLVLLWATDIRFASVEPAERTISFDQLVTNITSLFGESKNTEVDGSKSWRLKWWNEIVGYTFHGPYFWTGKGYGINLANADGFQVFEDASLRSPHNGHLTYLARGGVPQLVLHIAVQVSWSLVTFIAFVHAWRSGRKHWRDFFAFLIIYHLAFLMNATFDVYLEGPMGAIWFWCVYGTGLAAVRIYRTNPAVLQPEHLTGNLPAPGSQPARIMPQPALVPA